MPRYSTRKSGAPSRYSGQAESKADPGGVERAATVAAATLGLVGYLYALGGIVLWLRVQAAQLTPDSAIVAIDPRHLLAVGAKVVVFEIFLLLVISAVVTGLVTFAIVRRGRPTRAPYEQFGAIETAWKDKATLGGFIGPELGFLLLTVGLSVEDFGLRTALGIGGAALVVLALLAMIFRVPPRRRVRYVGGWRTTLTKLGEWAGEDGLRIAAALLLVAAVLIAIFCLPILQGAILLAGTVMIYAGPLLRWPGTSDFGTFRRELLLSSGIWTAIAVSTVVALAWVATPPVDFPLANVKSLDGVTDRSGAYLDRSDDGVYLGICKPVAVTPGERPESKGSHIRLIPTEESAVLEVGRGAYEFDPGGRPSIWMTVKAIVGGGSAAKNDAPLHHPFRGDAEHPCDSD